MLLDIPLWQIKDYHQTGSSVICNPPVTDTDIDFVVLVHDVKTTSELLCSKGWSICGDGAYFEADSSFVALRKAKLNYILIGDSKDYDRWEAAMLLAKSRNLTNKADRIELFRTIKAGVSNKPNKIEGVKVFDLSPFTATAWHQVELGITPTPFITTQGTI